MTKFPANAFSNNQCVPGETQSARPTASAAGKTVITNLSSFSDASGQKVSSATTDPRFSVEANELANAQIRARFEAATRKAESKVLGHDGNQASSTDSKSKSTDGASTSPLSAAIAAAAARRVRGAGGSSTAENANAQLMLHPPNATQIEMYVSVLKCSVFNGMVSFEYFWQWWRESGIGRGDRQAHSAIWWRCVDYRLRR
jgi:hypothetical protein